MFRIAFITILCALLVGCAGDITKRLPDDPDRLIVYSIDGPTYHD